jgi:hypothetical protein
MDDERSLIVRNRLKPVFRYCFISQYIPVVTVAKIVEDYLKPCHGSRGLVYEIEWSCFGRKDFENIQQVKVNVTGSLRSFGSELLRYISQVSVQSWKKPILNYKEYIGNYKLSLDEFHFVRSIYHHCLKRSASEGHTVWFQQSQESYSVQTVLKALTVINQIYLDSVFPNEKK